MMVCAYRKSVFRARTKYRRLEQDENLGVATRNAQYADLILSWGGYREVRSRITKYICSLRSKSTKCSRPRLDCRTHSVPCDKSPTFDSRAKAKQFAFLAAQTKNPQRGFFIQGGYRESNPNYRYHKPMH